MDARLVTKKSVPKTTRVAILWDVCANLVGTFASLVTVALPGGDVGNDFIRVWGRNSADSLLHCFIPEVFLMIWLFYQNGQNIRNLLHGNKSGCMGAIFGSFLLVLNCFYLRLLL